jgi:hypothetical protein
MAESTPWQLAKAGQNIPERVEIIPIFSHGTVPWPYQPQVLVVKTSGSDVPVYGVNTHQSS